MVWATSSPACCCWKEATMSVISPQPLSTCPLWGRGAHLERITSEQAVWKEVGRMEEGKTFQVANWAQPCFSQATLCPHFSCSPAFPRGPFRPICPLLTLSATPRPWRNASISLLCPFCLLGPTWPNPKAYKHPAGDWFRGRQCKQGRG